MIISITINGEKFFNFFLSSSSLPFSLSHHPPHFLSHSLPSSPSYTCKPTLRTGSKSFKKTGIRFNRTEKKRRKKSSYIVETSIVINRKFN